MWSLMGNMGAPDPKSTLKGGYHTLIAGSCLNPTKTFSYLKCNSLSVRNCQNNTNSSQEPKMNVEANTCNNNKKKRKKRKRRKKKKQQPPRERTISVESEDSFILFACEENSQSDEETETDFGSSDSIVPNKKVMFASQSKLCEVHPMIAWSFAYQAARKGPWEQYARDRCRFTKRVADVEAVIGHIFTKEHRSKIYEERFS